MTCSWTWWIAAIAVATPATILAVRWPKLGWWTAIVITPLSVEVPVGFASARIVLPQEPLLILVAVAWVTTRWREIRMRTSRASGHPVPWLVLATLVWIAICGTIGAAPIGSLKLLAVRTLHATVFFGIGLMVLEHADDWRRLTLIGAVSLAPVALLALVRLVGADFEPQSVYTSAAPFFPNRLELTIVAAFWLIAASSGPHPNLTRTTWMLSLAPAAVCVIALRSRTAWFALATGLVVRTLVSLRPRRRVAVAGVLAGALLLGAVAIDGARFWETRNRSRAAVSPLDPLWRWVATAAIAGDESVCERLNRWRCAVAMAADRPTTGFGPGSFEPSYGPYQRPDDLTRISTFTGDRGDAHSQLLGTLAEQGLIGLGLELSLAGAALLCGLRAAARATDRQRLATAAAWTGAIAGLTAAGLFAGWSDLPATGPAAFLAMAVLVRLDLGDPR